jgi:hypothetical protein
VYADYCSGRIWGGQSDASGVWDAFQLLDTPYSISTFGEDEAGALSFADLSSGSLRRIIAETSATNLLSVTKTGKGTGTIGSTPSALEYGSVCGVRFAAGTGLTLSAAGTAGSTFVRWTGDSDCANGVVTLSANRSCTAKFGVAFTDDPLIAGTTAIKAIHITELRTRINALRTDSGLAAYAWAEPSLVAGVSVPRASHIAEMRAALDEIYTHTSRPLPTYTSLAAGDLVRGIYVNELRLAVLDLE